MENPLRSMQRKLKALRENTLAIDPKTPILFSSSQLIQANINALYRMRKKTLCHG
jgi:hypothetical protein